MTTPYKPGGPPVPEPGKAFEGRKVRHGTAGGWRQHQHDGTDPCDPCFQAKSRYDWERKQATVPALRARLNAQAQGRAETRLRAAHPGEYERYYLEEREKAFTEAGQPVPKRQNRRTS